MIYGIVDTLMTGLMAYALFADDLAAAESKTTKPNPPKPKSHSLILYCQSCRKQKEHTVLVAGVYKCGHCGRITDLT